MTELSATWIWLIGGAFTLVLGLLGYMEKARRDDRRDFQQALEDMQDDFKEAMTTQVNTFTASLKAEREQWQGALDSVRQSFKSFETDASRELGRCRDWRHSHDKESGEIRLKFSETLGLLDKQISLQSLAQDGQKDDIAEIKAMVAELLRKKS